MDGVLINIVGVGIGVTTIFGGTIGILVKQARNNGRMHQRFEDLAENFESMKKDMKRDMGEIKTQCVGMSDRISTMEGYLQGMEEFRKRDGG